MHYRFGIPRREALSLRLGQGIVMPSGRMVWVEMLARHEVELRYVDSGARLALDRGLLARLLADANQPSKG